MNRIILVAVLVAFGGCSFTRGMTAYERIDEANNRREVKATILSIDDELVGIKNRLREIEDALTGSAEDREFEKLVEEAARETGSDCAKGNKWFCGPEAARGRK